MLKHIVINNIEEHNSNRKVSRKEKEKRKIQKGAGKVLNTPLKKKKGKERQE